MTELIHLSDHEPRRHEIRLRLTLAHGIPTGCDPTEMHAETLLDAQIQLARAMMKLMFFNPYLPTK
jgi:hypothetical protein